MPVKDLRSFGPLPILLAITVVFAMLPDFDALLGLIAGDIGRFHNHGTHSLVIGLVISVLAAVILRVWKKYSFFPWFLVLLISYESHVILDYFTWGGRGVMLFWPLSPERFMPPFTIFHGVRWSEGVYTTEHLWTVASELLIVLLIFLGLWFLEGRKRRRTELPLTTTKWIDSSQPLPDEPSGIKR
jgi:inner membrane protein